MDRGRAELSHPNRRVAAAARALTACALAACASDGGAKPTDEPRPAMARAWFGVKADDCAGVLPSVALALTKPGTTLPVPALMSSGGGWCSFEPQPGGAPTRADGVAQAVSGALAAPTVAFWATADAWSYGIYEHGESVFAMESHYGAPMLIGDEPKGAGLVGLPGGALYGYLASARQPDVAEVLASRIGASRPLPGSPLAPLPTPKPVEVAYDPKQHPPSPRLEAGSWAVLPPLGVVLVKEVTADGNYVLVDDDRTFPIPIERAGGLGMRRLASAEDAARALAIAEDGVDVEGAREYSADRAKGWLDTLKSGDLTRIAKTFAELCAVQAERKLFAIEQGLLETSREWLAEEVGTVDNKPADAITAALVDACE